MNIYLCRATPSTGLSRLAGFGLADATNFDVQIIQMATGPDLLTCVNSYQGFTTKKNSAKLAAFYAEHLNLQFTSAGMSGCSILRGWPHI